MTTSPLIGFDLDVEGPGEPRGLTELAKFDPQRMDGVADPASGFPILLMKAFAGPTEQWTAEDRAQILKQEQQARETAVRKAGVQAVNEVVDALQARLADVAERINFLEQSRPDGAGNRVEAHIPTAVKADGSKQCPKCGKYSKSLTSNHTFCTQCGHRLDAGGATAKSAPDPDALTADEAVHLAALVKRLEDPATRIEALGQLMGQIGPGAAAKVAMGEPLSPAEFTRAYLTNGRAALTAGAGQKPRIPDTSHTVTAEDFQRDPLASGHQRPTPLQMLQQAGQLGVYGTRG